LNQGSIHTKSAVSARVAWSACILLGLGCFGLGGLALCIHFFEEWGFGGGEGPLPALGLLTLLGIPGFLLAGGDLVVRVIRQGVRSIPVRPTLVWLSLSVLYLFLAAWVAARA